MSPTLARSLNGNYARPVSDVTVAGRWMSWQEIADRLERLIKDGQEHISLLPIHLIREAAAERLAIDLAVDSARRAANLALDLVALSHMQRIAAEFAKAYRKSEQETFVR